MYKTLSSSAGAVLAAMFLTTGSSSFAAGISVALDNARPVTLPSDASSVVVGNPAIADIYVQDSRNIFVLGRSYGTTNLVAIDETGRQIADMPITVTSGSVASVTLHRGTNGQMSYACNGRCERALIPSDDVEAYKALMDAVNGKTAQGEQVAEAASAAGK